MFIKYYNYHSPDPAVIEHPSLAPDKLNVFFARGPHQMFPLGAFSYASRLNMFANNIGVSFLFLIFLDFVPTYHCSCLKLRRSAATDGYRTRFAARVVWCNIVASQNQLKFAARRTPG